MKLWKDSERDDVAQALPALLQAVKAFGNREFSEQDLNNVTDRDSNGW